MYVRTYVAVKLRMLQVSGWPLEFYLLQGRCEIFYLEDRWMSMRCLADLEQLHVEPNSEHWTFYTTAPHSADDENLCRTWKWGYGTYQCSILCSILSNSNYLYTCNRPHLCMWRVRMNGIHIPSTFDVWALLVQPTFGYRNSQPLGVLRLCAQPLLSTLSLCLSLSLSLSLTLSLSLQVLIEVFILYILYILYILVNLFNF